MLGSITWNRCTVSLAYIAQGVVPLDVAIEAEELELRSEAEQRGDA